MATTTLAITPNFAKKTAKFKGTIAAGEHVAVTIQNDDTYVADTTNLRLRVIDPASGRTLAVFPLPVEEGETPETWASDTTPLSCTLNLNTVQMLMAVPPGATIPFQFVLDDRENETLYFKDVCEVSHWPMIPGEDIPIDLSGYRDFVEETKKALADHVAEVAAKLANAALYDENGRLRADGYKIPWGIAGYIEFTTVDGNNGARFHFYHPAVHGGSGVDYDLVIPFGAGQLATLLNLASAFSDSTTYSAGQLVVYENGLYRCTASHSGSWTAADFTTATVEDVLAILRGAIAAKYTKPSDGIPKSDLAAAVQTSLGKADTALQSHQDITGKADKVSSATDGNLAALDSNGNLVDSEKKPADFAAAATTYTKTEVDAAIAAAISGRFEVVEELPSSGEANVIYLVPRTTSETGNVYDEYIWMSGTPTGSWEKIGSTDIDLSGYIQKKTSGFTPGNLARFTSSGDIEDSGAKPSDFCGANDTRLTNARTPTAHASTHASGGSDPITPASIGAASTADATLTPIYAATTSSSSWSVTSDAQFPGPLVLLYDDGAWVPGYYDPDTTEWSSQGAPKGTSTSASISWSAEAGEAGANITATRTDAPVGYQLGSQSTKPIASEAEAEALRTAVAGKLAASDVIDPATATASGKAADALATKNALAGKQAALGYTPADQTAIAPEFDATASYAVGDVVMHNGARYKCTTAVSTAGAWNAANWTAESVETAIPYSQTLHTLAAGATSIALADHSGDYYDATALTSSDTVAVTLPAVTSGKVSDCVITIETGSSVPTLNFGSSGDVFIAADSNWATLTASAYNVITLTSAGANGKWIVGRITTAK